MSATANDTPKPQSALLLAVCILALFCAEAYWLYGWHSSNQDLFLANIRRSGQNQLDSRKITELRAASDQINGLYLRLQDPMASAPPKLEQLPLSTGSAVRQTEPTVIQDFVKAGLAAMPTPGMRSEPDVRYELASTRLEFHRLIPLVAQAENSNPFLFLDHVELIRPKTSEPFSMRPTALQTRFTARIFTPPPTQ